MISRTPSGVPHMEMLDEIEHGAWAVHEMCAPLAQISEVEIALATTQIERRAWCFEETLEARFYEDMDTEPAVEPADYLRVIVRPAAEAGLIPAAWLAHWERAMESGAAEADPRVQLFVKAASELLAGFSREFRAERDILVRVLGVQPGNVRLRFKGLENVLTCGDDYYVVCRAEDIRPALLRELRCELYILADRLRWDPAFARHAETEVLDGDSRTLRQMIEAGVAGDEATLVTMLEKTTNPEELLGRSFGEDRVVHRLPDGTRIVRILEPVDWLADGVLI